MAYTISRAELGSVKPIEEAFSTDQFLPKWDEIPDEFKRGNAYTLLAAGIFFGSKLPDYEMQFWPGFDDETAPADLSKCVRAHLRSFASKHEHKIAGVAYMIAQVCDLTKVAAVDD